MKRLTDWRRSLTPQQERLSRALLFLTRLLILSLPLYLVIWLGISLYPLQLAAASQSAWLLRATGHQVLQEGAGLLVNGGFSFFIIPDCTGWKGMLFLFALIFAVPGIAMTKRVWGLVIGLPLIWVANLGRICGVVLAQGVWGTDYALFLHDTLFQLGLLILVIGLWALWLRFPQGLGEWVRSLAASLRP